MQLNQELSDGLRTDVLDVLGDPTVANIEDSASSAAIDLLRQDEAQACSAFAARCSWRRAAAYSSRAACSLAMILRSSACSLGWQHFLYFLPLPQGQRSLRVEYKRRVLQFQGVTTMAKPGVP